MELKKLLIGVGNTQYGLLTSFANYLADGFRSYGVIVDIVDLNQKSVDNNTIKIEEYDLFFSFNGMMTESYLKYVTNRKNVLVWSFVVDHPVCLDRRLLGNWRYCIVSCVDRNHVEFMKKYFANSQWNCFLPHGGTLLSGDFSIKKVYDVTLLGSLAVGSQQEFDEKYAHLNAPMRKIVNTLFDTLFYNSNLSFEYILHSLLAEYGVEIDDNSFRNLCNELFFVDTYVRFKKRLAIVETLLNNDIEVHVYGTGWEALTGAGDKLVVHDIVPYDKTAEVISKSRIVINVMPLFASGSHERVFETMGHRTVCFSDRSIYLEEIFNDEEDIFFYSMKDLQGLANKIKAVLAGEYNEELIIANAYRKIEKNHTWRNRAKYIIDYVKDIQLPLMTEDKLCNLLDYQFNETLQYFRNSEIDVILNKMKASYFRLNKMSLDVTDSMCELHNKYKSWGSWNPEEDDFGVFENRIRHLKNYWSDYKELYMRLSDNRSKSVLVGILSNWETVDATCLTEIRDNRFEKFLDIDLISISENEVLVDIDAGCGEVVSSFINTYLYKYNKIYCYEKDTNKLKKLNEISRVHKKIIVKERAMDKLSIDKDITEPVTFVKVDSCMSTFDVVEGARNHIVNEHPKLAIAVHYRNEDVLRISKLIQDIDPNYKLYLRYYGSDICPDDIILYAI